MSKFTKKLAEMSPSQQRLFLNDPTIRAKTRQLSKLYKVLTNFDFITAKINHDEFGVQALINDYDLFNNNEILAHPEYNSETVKALKLIQGALKLSSHILTENNTQLAEQLWGRLQDFKILEIQILLEVAKKRRKYTTWLRPLIASLSTPKGRLLRILASHNYFVNAVTVTPDSKKLISCSLDTTIKLWDSEAEQELFTFAAHTSSVDAVAVTADGQKLISGSSDTTIKVWSLETQKEILTFTGHTKPITAIAVTPDSRRVISASEYKTLKVWDLDSGKIIYTLTRHTNWIYTVAVTSDGKFAISGSRDKTIKIWSLETGKLVCSLKGHIFWVKGIVVTPDDKQIISISNTPVDSIKIWDIETQREIITINKHRVSASSIAIFPDGKRIIVAWDNGELEVINLKTKKTEINITNNADFIQTLAINYDRQKLISGGANIKIWDICGKENHSSINYGHLTAVTALVITPDGNKVISSSDDSTIIIWNMITKEKNCKLTNHTHKVTDLALSFDSKYLISCSYDRYIKIWDIEAKTEIFSYLTGKRNLLQAVAITPDNEKLIYDWGDDIRVLDLKKSKFFSLKGHTSSVTRIAVTSSGHKLVTSSSDNTIKVWDLDSRKEIFNFNSHTRCVTTLAITPNGKQLISGSRDKTVKIWDLETGQEIFTFQLCNLKIEKQNNIFDEYPFWVTAVAVSTDGKYLFITRGDGSLQVWNLESRNKIATFIGESSLSCCTSSPDGVTIVAGDASGRLHFFCLEGVKA
ncbi:MAG: WD40 repeat domain-containing protein [Fischerella sp. CENA71]|nr:WD40 repeat domain-containing protein [Fischerella sp. CENA71]